MRSHGFAMVGGGESMDSDTLIPQSLFTVDHLSEHERYDFWRDSISCIFDVECDRDVRQNNFNARVEAQICGQLMLAATTTLKQNWERSSSTIARCGVDHYMIQLYESGYMAFEHQGQEFVLQPGDVIIFDLSEKAYSTTNNFSNFSIIVPRNLLAPLLKDSNGHHLRIMSRADPLVRILHGHMLSMKAHANKVYLSKVDDLNSATIALLAAAMNGSPHDGPVNRKGKPIAQSILVKRVIDEQLSDPNLNPEGLAKMMAMSRSKLYSIFETYGGVKSYLRERRLSKALSALSSSHQAHRSVGDIAFSLGFASEATFRRNFKSRYGLLPTEVRQRRLTFESHKADHNLLDRRYEAWVRDLSV